MGIERFKIDMLPEGCDVRVAIGDGRVRFQAVDANGKVYAPSEPYAVFENDPVTIRWEDLTAPRSP